MISRSIVFKVLLAFSALLYVGESQATLNVLLTSSLTRLADDETRIPDASFGVGVLVSVALMDFLNQSPTNIPLTRSQPFTCDVTFNVQIIDDVSDFSTGLFQISGDNVDLDATHVIIGPGRSSVCVPTSFVTSTSQLPVFSPSCTSPELDDADAHRFFARTIPSDEATAIALVALLKKLPEDTRVPLNKANAIDATKKYTKVAVIYQEDTYGSNFKDSLFENRDGIEFVLIPFKPGNLDSLERAVNDAEETKVNVFVGILFVEHLANLISLTIDKGMMGEDNIWIFTDGVLGGQDILTELESANSLRNDIVGLSRDLGVLNNNFFIQATGKADSNEEIFGSFVDDFLEETAGYDRDRLKQVFAAIPKPENSEGFDFPVQDFAEFIDTLFEHDSVTEKPLAVSDFALFGYDAIIAIREAIDRNTDCSQTQIDTLFEGINFMDALRTLKFDGVTGPVEFDPETLSRASNSSAMKLVNFRFSRQGNSFFSADANVAFFQDSEWDFRPDLLFPGPDGLAGGVKNAPLLTDPPENVQRNEVSEPVIGVVYTIAAIVLISVGFLIIFVFTNTHRNVIAAAQPIFLIIMLLGVVISTCSVFVLIQDPLTTTSKDTSFGSVLKCNAPFVLISLGLTISYASLVFKLQRLVMIAQLVPNLRYKKVSVFDTFKYMIFVVALNIIVIVICFAIDPLELQQRVISADEFGQPQETFDICTPDSGQAGVYSLYFIFHILFYIYGIRLIVQVRNLSTDFQEGRWITMSILSQLQINLLGIPVVVAIGAENTEIRFMVLSLLVILCNTVLLLLIFAPKLYKIFTGDDVVWEPHRLTNNNNSKQTQHKGSEDDDDIMTQKAELVRRSLEGTMATQDFGFEEHSL